jgi:type VI secretion system protein ImpC
MRKRWSYADVQLDVAAGPERSTEEADSETPFRIVILGDFSGRANRGLLETGEALANRSPILIDRDNYDTVMRKLSPQLHLPLKGEGGLGLALKFNDLDDFHPDRLFERSTLFRKLWDLRQKLNDPDAFAAAAKVLGLAVERPPEPQSPPESEHASAADVQQITSGSLLDEMIERTEERAREPRPSRAPDPLTLLINRIVAPHRIAKADPRQAELLDLIDEAASAQMRALLHAGAFQQLEAAWRAVFLLVRNLETSSQLKLFLIDVSKQELAADLSSSDNLSSTATHRLLAEKTTGTLGAEPWTLMAGNFTFAPAREDTELLGRIAKVAAAAGAPFVAGVSPRLLGCDAVEDLPDPACWQNPPEGKDLEAWQTLRKSPEAKFLGLLLPRFLLRLPYGKETETTELFPFEESSEPADHEDYLWGNPAFAATLLLGQTFTEQGWAMRPGSKSDISGLPYYAYTAQGEPRTLPCAEVLMTRSAAETILEKGFMPLASLKNQPTVRLVRFQSIADPLAPLAGRWQA